MERVGKLVKAFTYANTSSFAIGALPPNSVVTGVKVIVKTAFNAGSNDYLDVGTATTAALMVDNLDLATKGVITGSMVATTNDEFSAVNSVTIKAIYVPAGSAPTTGSGVIVVEYAQL